MKKLFATSALALSMLIASPAFAHYTVQSGDTLGKIATENSLTLQQLANYNPQVSNIDLIFVGQGISMNGTLVATPTPTTVTEVQKVKPVEKVKAKADSQPQPSKSQEGTVTMTVSATAYTAFCEGCSGVTRTGIDLRSNPNQKVIAVDPNVIPLGSKVYVEGYGMAIAGDTGGAIKGNKIDLFMKERSDALNFGRQTVKITVYK